MMISISEYYQQTSVIFCQIYGRPVGRRAHTNSYFTDYFSLIVNFVSNVWVSSKVILL